MRGETILETPNTPSTAAALDPPAWLAAEPDGATTAAMPSAAIPAGLRDATDIRLRDGTPVRIRAIRRSDLELERRFVAGLSRRTRYLRLLSGRDLLPGELERWTDIDPAREIAVVAVANDGGSEQEIGVARCAVDDEAPARWDFAIVVADAWQGQGLGEALLRRLMQCADEAGVASLSGLTLSENHRMLSLARRLGFTARREPGDAALTRVEKRLRA
jgi:acetyltransferase